MFWIICGILSIIIVIHLCGVSSISAFCLQNLLEGRLEDLTDRCQSTAAFSDCSTTPNETDNEKQSSNSNNGHCWDEGVHVFKEVIVVVVCDEDISANVTQDTSSRLQAKTHSFTYVLVYCPTFRLQIGLYNLVIF